MTYAIPESAGSTSNPVPKNSFVDPNSFVARDRGTVNRPNRHIKATASNSSASLTNMAPVDSNDKKIHLWITEFETGWRLTGDVTQSAMHKSFYPRNMGQYPVTLRGVMPNQYEYDRLVHFVTVHHKTALNVSKFYPVRFAMARRRDKVMVNGREVENKIYEGKLVDGVITKINAGHKRFVYAVPFEIQMLVVKDKLDTNVTDQGEIYQRLNKRYINSLLSVDQQQPAPNAPEEPPNIFDSYWHQVGINMEGIQ